MLDDEEIRDLWTALNELTGVQARYPAFVRTTFPHARKPHECCECGRAITPGTQYADSRGVWDGSFDSYAQCMECRALFRDVNAEHHDEIPFGGLSEFMLDVGREIPRFAEAWAKISGGAP